MSEQEAGTKLSWWRRNGLDIAGGAALLLLTAFAWGGEGVLAMAAFYALAAVCFLATRG